MQDETVLSWPLMSDFKQCDTEDRLGDRREVDNGGGRVMERHKDGGGIKGKVRGRSSGKSSPQDGCASCASSLTRFGSTQLITPCRKESAI